MRARTWFIGSENCWPGEHLQALLDAGWSTTEIVTLSQLVAFLSFQIRVVVGLRVLFDRTAS